MSSPASEEAPAPAEQSRDVVIEQIATIAQDSPATDNDDAAVDASNTFGDLDEAAALHNLTTNVRDQDDLERDITYKANLALIEVEDAKDEKRIERAQANIVRLEAQKRLQDERFRKAIGRPDLKTKIKDEIARIQAEIGLAEQDVADFHTRIDQRHQDGTQEVQTQSGSRKLPNESHREFLIRTGKITPFANFGGSRPEGVEGGLASALVDAEDEAVAEELEEKAGYEPRSHQNLRAPGFAEESTSVGVAAEAEFSLRPRKRKRITRHSDTDDDYTPQTSAAASPGAAFIDDDDDDDDDALDEDEYDMTERTRKRSGKRSQASADGKIDLSQIDDGNEANYQDRLANWVERRSRARALHEKNGTGTGEPDTDQSIPEWFKPSPDTPDHHFEDGLRLPGDVYPALFDYQKTAVQWLGELYKHKVGGIIGDEMGLGKTVQLISFVTALHYSQLLDKPVIVVAPATVLRQWVNEFHRWWPPLRVSILHSSGSGMYSESSEDRIEEEELAWNRKSKNKPVNKAAKKIVDRVVKHGHVLVTTYAGLQTYGEILIPIEWGYAVLDEGHKIRNPNTAITIYCKELRTPNRVILSGTPMQNNLMELWSLFDFIFPMRLGTLVDFRNQFEIPIKLGGYANATNLQIMTAQKCAETLKDTISPYLLQRLKVDVAADLPKKSEQVLFCKLTRPQREAYELFLNSGEMSAILNKTRQSLYGIDILRKICNHPDLLDPHLRAKPDYKWGAANKSGKMQVVKALLQMWKRFGHKTLLFSQGVQMLNILEDFVKRQDGISYIRMDGSTAIKDRQTLVDRFNKDPTLDLFLLTTKVGGLGVNLTGANRVIIFDPDWNPSTDVQARERAWRLGQKKEVTIYRLMTAGTIEEKIYHRQIFKQFLSNKVLKDPKQRTTFQLHDLHDLFTLGSAEEGKTETGRLFEGTEVKFNTGTSAKVSQSTTDLVELQDESQAAEITGDDVQQVQTIEGVASLEDFKQEGDDEPPPTEESRIMEGLFARSGVHQALEHDDIVNGKKKPQASRAMLQREADRVAAAAAASLRRAGEQARNVPIGTVTWTGEVGEAGRPINTRRAGRGGGGPSSAGILAGIADRQGINLGSPRSGLNSATTSRSGTPTSSSGRSSAMHGKDFEKAIPVFIRQHGGQVPTKLLVDHFNRYCITSQQSAEFKNALNKVARMEKKGSSMRALWALR
ncbi:SNF2 family N-terminal domain-containing protein [Microdochium trichocladiopsis]|uniref:SNF2 family N-terminal domain-containing protein n=1 Tax=Microdochium trichocladiopsis TaxID=1682393 RepID=A0A9P9BSN4_9PEZI|nr:SNF2 family N-terminal domain-containing protein [Microdochium trichocladiopsis]KAH7038080.1 SNF2 family N-terminal domain-containing protein [Microdochium trichocladiopsis]